MNRFVIVDLETTGNSPKKGDKIIQFGAVIMEGGQIIEEFSTFINPLQPIPAFIEQLTGITDEMVLNAPTFEQVAPKIATMLKESYFVAHNVLFDLGFLQEEFKGAHLDPFLGPILDTVEMTRILYPTLTGYRLSHLADSFNISHDRPHQADSDAEVTAQILLKLIHKLHNLPSVTLRKLLHLSVNFTSDIEELIEGILFLKERSGENEEQNFDIIRNIALRKDVVNLEANEDQSQTQPSYSSTRDMFIQKLKNNELFENSVFRESQIEMMDIIQQAFHKHDHALIEAGTGLGKSIAYLIPATIHALVTIKPVVVSTYTLQLQQQLYDKEMGLINKILDRQANAVVVKGKGHYLCLSKFEETLRELDDNYDSNLSKAKILVWLTETETGDMDEINLPSGGQLLWEKISVGQMDNLYDDAWEHRCFYKRMKKKAKKATIIITNHALLCRDIFEENILPAYEEVIIDEAHHFEEIVNEYLGRYLEYNSIHFTLNRMGSIEEGGILSKLRKLLSKHKELIPNLELLEKQISFLKEEMDELFRMLKTYVLKRAPRGQTDYGRVSYRISSTTEIGKSWHAILECVNRIRFSLFETNSNIDAILSVYKLQKQASINENITIVSLFDINNRFIQWREYLQHFFVSEGEDMTTWMEVEEKGAINSTYLFQQYLNVDNSLADLFFAKKKSVVLTSATLTVRQSFDYMVKRLGLEDFLPICKVIPSPFNYHEQAKIFIPTDLPNIKAVDSEEYIGSITMHLATIARLTNGRMLVLFTSKDMLKRTYHMMKERRYLEDFTIIAQGITGGSRSKITKSFLQFERSILLGTNSFWEGIDFPGDSLTCLVIVRLPFISPELPLFAARAEKIELAGGNSFNELSLPLAILRFKQGFGRLIRTEKDKGILIVFDKRIVTTWYGKSFIQSLPEVSVKQGSLTSLLDDVKEWLSKE
ncbi:ATP-dependent DNA helicase DinG [Bacillus salitolerans]|uniref:3'-5' exonuclease DinG n=1 Tax=Bacillus salitolerans TaxID=1437434 RepID=A0ABW4LUP6_9BACI